MTKKLREFNETHPNSIEARAREDSHLSSLIFHGRINADAALMSMEKWARDGFVSIPGNDFEVKADGQE